MLYKLVYMLCRECVVFHAVKWGVSCSIGVKCFMLYRRMFHNVQYSVSCCTVKCVMLYRGVFHAEHKSV